MKNLLHLSLLLSAALISSPATSQVSSDTVIVFVLAQGDRCITDQPLLSDEMSVSLGNWMKRNANAISAAKEKSDFKAAYDFAKGMIRDEKLQSRQLCAELIHNLNDQRQDLDKPDR